MEIKSHPFYQKIKSTLQSWRDKIISEEDRVHQEAKTPTYKKIVKWTWYTFIAGLVFVAGLIIYAANQDLPTFDELEDPKSSLATELYFSTGEVMGRYFIENRVNVSYQELNPHLVNCLVSTEDKRYRKHSGIDAEALVRVAVKTVLFGSKDQGGGSTVTQQLAKLLYSDRDLRGLNPISKMAKLLIVKFKEWVTAVKLEKAYTKDEIIAMYLNKYSFINDSYGIKAAAETYFGKDQADLEIEEAATLVGMLKNASFYNPNRFKDRAEGRRNTVLARTKDMGHMTQEVYDSIRAIPLDMSNFKRSAASIGPAPYFRSELKKPIQALLNDEDNRKADGTKYDIYKDGLRIYTTIDSRVQGHLEDAIMEHMPVVQERFWKVWSNQRKNPWEYVLREDGEAVTTPEELQTRQLVLERLVTESDRYKHMKTVMIGKEVAALADAVDKLRVTDRVIDRLYREETDGGVITTLLSVDRLTTNSAALYRKALKSDAWKTLLPRYEAFKSQVKKKFQEPVKMKAFAYNDRMEVDTMMTPMDSIMYHRMFLQVGSMAVDPVTGHVLGWVGGINHKYYKFDHVKSARLVGSSFKPFIYATAISQQGLSPCFGVYDQRQTIHANEPPFLLPKDWSPKNIDNKYTGDLYTLFDGLRTSKNTISVFLMKQLGNVNQVRSLVNNMGIAVDEQLSNGQLKVPQVPAICLGAANLSVFEMTGAYTSFANNGVFNKPVFISRIEDRNGRLVYESISEERQALNPVANHAMVKMLDYALNENLPNFRGLKSEMGGKTGTTNDYTDAWFMGITPNVVLGTWIGGDDPWIRFLNGGTGSRLARPIFAKFMHRMEQDSVLNFDVTAKFNVPAGVGSIELNCDNYDNSGVAPSLDPDAGTDDPFGDDPFGNDSFDTDPFEGDEPFDTIPTIPDTTNTGI